MAQIIINEGNGPRPVDLSGTVTLGSNPSCDVVLEDGSALGTRVELRPLRFGYRAVAVKGEVFVNERATELADLEHGDTLRVGDVLVLYKQPEGDAFEPGRDGRDEQPELEPLLDLDEAEEPELELVEPEPVIDAGAELVELDDVEELEELELLEPVVERSEELDLGGDDERGGEDLDQVAHRARLKRLEALRRLDLARCGQVPRQLPDLSAPGALDVVEALESAGHVADLDQLEKDEGLEELTLPQLLERVAAAQADVPGAEPPAAEPEPVEEDELEVLEELPELEPVRSSAEAGLDDALVRAERKRLEALRRVRLARDGEFPELADLSAPGALDVVAGLDDAGRQELEAFEQDAGLADATPRELLDEVARLKAAAEAAAAEPEPVEEEELEVLEELPELETVEELEELEELEPAEELAELEELEPAEELTELEELEELEPVEEAAPAAVVAPVPVAPAAPARPAAVAPSRPAPVAPAPVPSSPGYAAPRPSAPAELPVGARPLPEEGLRFTRPLPAGLAPPAFLPPAHPGNPPA